MTPTASNRAASNPRPTPRPADPLTRLVRASAERLSDRVRGVRRRWAEAWRTAGVVPHYDW